MWDNPRLLNAIAGFLTAIGAVAFVAAGAHLLLRSPVFPLREVQVRGTLVHTARADVEVAMRSRITGNFFAADLGSIRGAFEQLPWVRRVEVRRAWPDRLEVTIEEHRALARWAGGGLVNVQGERFAAEGGERLPLFTGPEGSAADVARRYRRFAELAGTLGLGVERVTLNPRRAWQLALSNGLHVELGRELQGEPPEARFARFVAAWPATLGRIHRAHEYVDLRYPNGFALRLPGA